MTRATRLSAAGIAVVVSLISIALVTAAFTPSEQRTIKNMKQRMARIETAALADKAAWQVEADAQAQRIASLEDAVDSITGDLGTLADNDILLGNDIDILDAGLSGIVAPDGPIAQIDENLLYTQGIVFDNHPQIALTDINPLVVCDVSTCTVDIEWTSTPPATGQVEWGPTPALGTFTTKEESLLGYHKQRIGQLPADGATYYFRITAEIPETGASASVDLTAELG